MSLKSETKDTPPQTAILFYFFCFFVLFYLQKMFFRKQKFNVKQLKMNKFIFNFKQLKMNKLIKPIYHLIISTSNATLEVPSLRPCAL